MTMQRLRDVDRLDPVPDGLLAAQDAQYLVKLALRPFPASHTCDGAVLTVMLVQERHQLEGLFKSIVTDVVMLKPMDPVQYIIDYVEYNAEYAKQVSLCWTSVFRHVFTNASINNI